MSDCANLLLSALTLLAGFFIGRWMARRRNNRRDFRDD